jgi:hypothetical protein
VSVIQPLNLPKASLKLEKKQNELYVWCVVRKKKLLLTPEEWVRQHLIHLLINEWGIPIERIVSEYGITVNGLSRRCDVVAFNQYGIPKLIVECKATTVPINHDVLFQIAQYNRELKVDYLMLSNGLIHHLVKINHETGELDPKNALTKEMLDKTT